MQQQIHGTDAQHPQGDRREQLGQLADDEGGDRQQAQHQIDPFLQIRPVAPEDKQVQQDDDDAGILADLIEGASSPQGAGEISVAAAVQEEKHHCNQAERNRDPEGRHGNGMMVPDDRDDIAGVGGEHAVIGQKGNLEQDHRLGVQISGPARNAHGYILNENDVIEPQPRLMPSVVKRAQKDDQQKKGGAEVCGGRDFQLELRHFTAPEAAASSLRISQPLVISAQLYCAIYSPRYRWRASVLPFCQS